MGARRRRLISWCGASRRKRRPSIGGNCVFCGGDGGGGKNWFWERVIIEGWSLREKECWGLRWVCE